LWNLDIRVYHQLLESYFVEGLKLEERYSWLPRIRSNMLQTQATRKKGVLARVVWFYLVGNSVALFVAFVGTTLAVNSVSDFGLIGVFVTAGVGILVIFIWGRKIKRETCSPLLEAWSNKANTAEAKSSAAD
jgi:hypothetical protein